MPETGNLLLASLASADVASLRQHLKPIHLEQQQVLFGAGDFVEDVYFPTGAVVSLVLGLAERQPAIEAHSARTDAAFAGAAVSRVPRGAQYRSQAVPLAPPCEGPFGQRHLNFTQEFLAEMLGVQRVSVTVVAHTLQRAGMIRYARGKIQITDVESLREAACECYEAIKAQHGDLLGHRP